MEQEVETGAWKQEFSGKYSRETWTRADGLYRVIDRSASWGRATSRPYIIETKTPGGIFQSLHVHGSPTEGYKRLGYYATAEAAMAAVDKNFPATT